jgi:hypothetical protein
MVAQMITAPFKVVSVPTSPSLTLEADAGWQKAMSVYGITYGEFTMTGGIAGRSEKFALAGDVRTMREGKLVTFLFDIRSSGTEKPHSLKEAATGVVENGNVDVWRIGAGSLIEMPHSDLSAKGKFDRHESQLTLNLTSLPTMIADGYSGGGSIQAETKSSPAAEKSNDKPL